MPRKYAVRMVETHLSLGPRTDPFTKSLAVLWTFCKSAAKCQQSTLLARLGNHEQFCGNTRGTCGAQAFCTFSPYAAWLCSVLHMENACSLQTQYA